MGDPAALDLRVPMANLASGVSLVATRDVVGRDCGLTITSLVSLSLDPPLCLVAVKRGGFLHDALEVSQGWAVTMLAVDQMGLAQYAARHRYPSDTDDFGPYPHRRAVASDSLYFTDGVAALDCVPERLLPGGDHTIVVGRVVGVADDCTGVQPLVYHQRRYTTVDAARDLA
jgi:flavin reductase (DIM6/NTAB) family NADH-FMN oxidoreductase RutF